MRPYLIILAARSRSASATTIAGAFAELKVDLGDVRCGVGHDLGAGLDAAGEAHQPHVRVPRQGATGGAAPAINHVEDTLRQVCLGHEPSEQRRVVGGLFARLDDDRIAGDKCRRHLARDQEEREVPGQDAGDHAQRLAEEEDALSGPIALDDLALDPPRLLGHVVDVVGGKDGFDPC